MWDPIDERVVPSRTVDDLNDLDNVADAFKLVGVPSVLLDELFALFSRNGLNARHAELASAVSSRLKNQV
jgi:hypothetical protein